MYTLKIFDSFFWWNFKRVDEISKIEIEESLESFDLLKLNINYYMDQNQKLNCEWLREVQKVQLISTWKIETIVFEGFIYDLTPDFLKAELIIRDFKWLLIEKKLFIDKHFINKSLKEIINELLNELNARSSSDDYPENWIYEIDNDFIITDKEFKKWTDYFNILKELSLMAKKEWTVKNWVILIKDILWSDKTTGENFTELVFNKNAPDENNISDVKIKNFWTIKNSILTSSENLENTESIEIFWRLEEYNNIKDEELVNYLEKISKRQRLYSFVIDYKRVNTELQIWDKIIVSINSWIEFLDIFWELFITKRKIVLKWNEIVFITVEVSEIVVRKIDFRDTINGLQDNVWKLLL